MDAIEELIEHCRQRGKPSPTLKRVHQIHRKNPQVLDFLVSELWAVRADGWTKASLGSLWHYARWVLTTINRAPGETFAMSNNLFPHYGRIIAILHPDLNGFYEMYKSAADADFGTTIEPPPFDRKARYVRRLTWADGAPVESGWRPAMPHEPKPVKRRERVKRGVEAGGKG